MIKRNDHVTYTSAYGFVVRAIVRHIHRDNSITVEPTFFVKEDGTDCACYIGGRERILVSDATKT